MAHKGTSTFIAQRASAVVLLPLAVWLAWSLAAHAGDSYEEIRAWLGAPVNAVLMAGFVLAAAFHMRIGLGEVIDDYIHSGLRGLCHAANWLFSAAVGLAALYAAWRLAFAG
ncbi:succinate dehydrogenase, hydrophobic membrane anchor protein [Amphiplicatus metriothermophilus]|uniref:Succinate dehydrogenase hydrophobic membrane anchor subunit n=1 Tax=Amphiplicatus metriothermophilus TaxID=1519374 RepID=A0A239PK03_9PROT|nr:succinate dehydrogenase, hydrophobic membrane anchor protein [Amphiplicatus metriothermophilus]MBB5517786.1 succinate dehydrogenase / fumarate reductase membrane anchor subunit [Amphiplicatus metriothermophilus]SNT67880.1 succinate dehydrogenase subunit D [Amphiplicatus metriothermophilus]